MEYTVVINGKPQGPYTFEELKALDIKSGTFVRKPGMDDYKEAHEIEELRELFGFRFRQTAPQYFASFDQRFVASMADYFFIIMGYVILVLITFIFLKSTVSKLGVALSLLVFVPVVKLIYSSFAEASARQGTIGKRLVEIKVGDQMGNRIPLSVSFGRNLAKIISTLPFFAGYLYCFLNRKNQCLHDAVANTLVTKQRLI